MRCPLTSELWQHYRDTGNPQVASHLASCAACRAEAEQYARLETMLSALTEIDAPQQVDASLRTLATLTDDTRFTCADTLELLEAWREGELDAARAFLLEDHLLWCDPCSLEVERAETLSVTLAHLPVLDAPEAVADRIAAGRLPWWRRLLLPTPAPSFSQIAATMAVAVDRVPAWSRIMVTAGAVATVLLFALTLSARQQTTNLAKQVTPQVPIHHVTPVPPAPVMPVKLPEQPVIALGGPQTPTVGHVTDTHAVPTAPTRRIERSGTRTAGNAPSTTSGQRPNGGRDKGGTGTHHPYTNPTIAEIPQPGNPQPQTNGFELPPATSEYDNPGSSSADMPVAVIADASKALTELFREGDLAEKEEALSSLPEKLAFASPRREMTPPAPPKKGDREVETPIAGAQKMLDSVVSSLRKNGLSNMKSYSVTVKDERQPGMIPLTQ